MVKVSRVTSWCHISICHSQLVDSLQVSTPLLIFVSDGQVDNFLYHPILYLLLKMVRMLVPLP